MLGAHNLDVPAWEGALVPYLELVAASPEPSCIARELLLCSANEVDGNENGDEEVIRDGRQPHRLANELAPGDVVTFQVDFTGNRIPVDLRLITSLDLELSLTDEI
ncbi:hypothetical protein FS749_016615 [Ceratobasidium sp. UAMH 11750]|nr:hypothetical protein FS749_016615 [Ceratobasidium sp. UAMH 11750]